VKSAGDSGESLKVPY